MSDTKTITIQTNKAIIYLWDLKVNEPRRIIFGDPEELYNFFVDQSTYLHDRLRKMSGKYKSKEQLKNAIEETRMGFEKDNVSDAFGEGYNIEVSYKIVKNNRKQIVDQEKKN